MNIELAEADRSLVPIKESNSMVEVPSEFRPLMVSRRCVSSTAKEYANEVNDFINGDDKEFKFVNIFLRESNTNIGYLSRHFMDLLELICNFTYIEINQLSYDMVREKVANILTITLYMHDKHIDGFFYSVESKDRDTYIDALSRCIYYVLHTKGDFKDGI